MTVHYIKKNVIDVELGIIAHGCNCQGKMGSGVAKAIRNKWPHVYYEYVHKPIGKTMLGVCHLVRINEDDSLWVANLYTQVFYGYGGGRYADPSAINTALDRCGFYSEFYDLPIYMPKIGCGLGGLSWEEEVRPIVEKMVEKHKIDVYVCEL